MSLKWLWLCLALLVPLLAVALWRLRYPAKRRPQFVGDVSTAAKLPSYARERRRGQILRWMEIGFLSLLIIILALLAGRPQQQIRKVEYQNSRDIVLCMDISGSMKKYIEPSLKTLKNVVSANPTDRYSLVLFGNVPYVALPLTSDTVAIDFVVSDLSEQFASTTFNAARLLGFDGSLPGGTDVGAGLVSCFRRFDNIEQKRSRHIILISDMQHNGITDQSAVATLLPKYDVKLYIVAPDFDVETAQESPVAEITGAPVEGMALDGSNAEETLRDIYGTILTARRNETYVSVDAPYIFWGAAVVAAGGWAATLYIRWRRR